MRKRLKRTVAASVLVALTALSVILVISMSGDSVSAGMREGTIGFSDEGAEIQKESLSQPVLENSSAALYLSENGSVTFLDKNTGVTYSNTAGEAGKGVFSNDDNELKSPVILHYLAEQKNQSVIFVGVMLHGVCGASFILQCECECHHHHRVAPDCAVVTIALLCREAPAAA